jgi:hypothetical protein
MMKHVAWFEYAVSFLTICTAPPLVEPTLSSCLKARDSIISNHIRSVHLSANARSSTVQRKSVCKRIRHPRKVFALIAHLL